MLRGPFYRLEKGGSGVAEGGGPAACAASMAGTAALGACWHTVKDCGASARALAWLDDLGNG
jgi:hypothetical protein